MKARYAPWVDAMIRFEGPIARQNQRRFVTDWMEAGGDDIRPLLEAPLTAPGTGFAAQVIGTGPTIRCSARSAMPGTAASTRPSSFRRATIRGSSQRPVGATTPSS